MMEEFASMRISKSDKGQIDIEQFCMSEDNQIISFPLHQAKAICAAIMREVKAAKE